MKKKRLSDQRTFLFLHISATAPSRSARCQKLHKHCISNNIPVICGAYMQQHLHLKTRKLLPEHINQTRALHTDGARVWDRNLKNNMSLSCSTGYKMGQSRCFLSSGVDTKGFLWAQASSKNSSNTYCEFQHKGSCMRSREALPRCLCSSIHNISCIFRPRLI